MSPPVNHLIYDLPWSSQHCVWPAQRANYPELLRTGGRRAAPTIPMLLGRPPTQTQVSRHATAAVTMLVNGLTRLETTNKGSTEHGVATLCCQVAVYSRPFRQHDMTVVEIIIAVLQCRTDGVLAFVHSCTISYDIWASRLSQA